MTAWNYESESLPYERVAANAIVYSEMDAQIAHFVATQNAQFDHTVAAIEGDVLPRPPQRPSVDGGAAAVVQRQGRRVGSGRNSGDPDGENELAPENLQINDRWRDLHRTRFHCRKKDPAYVSGKACIFGDD